MYYDTKGCKSLSFVRDYDDMPLLGEYGACGIIIIIIHKTRPTTRSSFHKHKSNYKTPMYQTSGAKSMLYSLASGELVSCQSSTFCKKGLRFLTFHHDTRGKGVVKKICEQGAIYMPLLIRQCK